MSLPLVTINVHVDDLEAALALYDRIQFWRSATELGTYIEITADGYKPAIIDGSVAGPWALAGKTLTVVLSGADPVNINFVGPDPVDLTTALQQINSVISAFASEFPSDTNKVRLTSPIVGTGSSITISGSAAATLGLSTTKVNGKGNRIALTIPTTEYTFKDFDGDPTFWYKYRFFSTKTLAVGTFSDPQQGNPGQVLPGPALVQARISLVDAAGAPIVGRRVIFVPMTPMVVPTTEYGILPGFDRITITTDSSGKASLPLAIGMTVKVFIEGSQFNREFVVPDADFDVLQVATTKPDPLNIVVAPPMPIRVS